MGTRKLGRLAIGLTLLGLAAGCPQEPQTPPAINIDTGTDAGEPTVPTVNEAPADEPPTAGETAAKTAENPFVDETPLPSPAAEPASVEPSPAKIAPAPEGDGKLQGPELRMPNQPRSGD
ncbi:MAG: hypothetical protein GXY83_32650 [Rhodopirellula sp.]|nr:hypothetical protein [Rhodopirellula sp.]